MNRFSPLPPYSRAVARWLGVTMALIVLMVALGGVTRLTESGLSIVEWKLFSGTFPPLSTADWQAEFAAYKTSPQFLKVNAGFGLADFQQIFWLEYLHRLLGRLIGLSLFLPLGYFACARALPRPLLWRMGWAALLVAAQGTVGWIMVASGLVDQPRVAPIKLALHLTLAFSLFLLLLWTYWQVRGDARPVVAPRLARYARLLAGITLAQLVLGALVAGLRAGKTYNTYPLMDGQWVPDGLYRLSPWWQNHLENVTLVQFQHRMGALVVVLSIAAFIAAARRIPALFRPCLGLAGAVTLQFSLGVATLLSVVNLWLASAHQLAALLLLSMLLRIIYLLPLGRG